MRPAEGHIETSDGIQNSSQTMCAPNTLRNTASHCCIFRQFPVFAAAREKARQTSCASNLKQLALGVLQYCQDYDEVPPCGMQASYQTGANYTGLGWGGQIYSYVKSAGVYDCPDDINAAPSGGLYPVSYAYNQNLLGITNNFGTTDSGNLSKLGSASMTILLTEVASQGNVNLANGEVAAGTNGAGCPTPDPPDSPIGNGLIGNTNFCLQTIYETGPIGCKGQNPNHMVTGSLDSTHFPTGRHLTGANYAFWDGHVKLLRATTISPGQNPSPSSATAQENNNGNPYQAGGTNGTNLIGGTYTATYSVY